jgi:NitT/TauT family transport system ATP-binding protein
MKSTQTMNECALLSLRHISKSFPGKHGPVPVLNGLSLDVYEQDFVSIIGPSGCGKSTVFNIIAGLIDPDEGEILLKGERIDSLRGKVGYMMQKDLLLPWRTVLENVVLGIELRGVTLKESKDLALEYLYTYGLAGFEHAYPKSLSGGMRQRVALIRTLICDPQIILLDEPFSALDYQTRLYLEGILVEAVETFKKTVVLVTHDIDEAVALSKRVVVLGTRPAKIKNVYPISFGDGGQRSPVAARNEPAFAGYFHTLCGDLDIQTTMRA